MTGTVWGSGEGTTSADADASAGRVRDRAVLGAPAPVDGRPSVTYRQAGDEYLLVEYGPNVLDFDLRFRVHALMTWLADCQVEGIVDLTPGIRSLDTFPMVLGPAAG